MGLDNGITVKMGEDKAILKEIISKRRSTFPKQFTGELIPDSTIEEILDLAHMAPNHKNTMPWRYYIYSGQSMNTLLDFKKEFYLKNTAEDKVKKSKLQAFEDRKSQTSHIIGIVVHKNERINLPTWEEMAAVACSVQNIYLSLNTYGIGGYWSTGNLTNSQDIRKYLKLEENEDFIGFMYLGITEMKIEMTKRESIGDRVKWIKD